MAKIAIVLNSSWNIFNFRLPLLKHLEGLGHQIVAIAPEDEYTEKIPYEFHPIKMKSRSTNPLQHLAVLGRLVRLFRKIKPDIALLYTIQPNTHGNIAARLTGVRTISNIAGLGNLFIDQRLATRIATALYRFALKHPDTVFFQNNEDMQMFIDKGVVRPEKATRIHGSGVDIKRFSPVPREKKEGDPFVFLMASRMLWEKGVEEFAEAARIVRKQQKNAVFKLIGPLDADNPSALNSSDMDALTANGNVEYLGSSDRMESVIECADCVVLPTYYGEGLPKILLEATAMGKPIITTRVPGCADAVDEGRNGLFCEVKNAESLSSAMLEILQKDVEELNRMGQASRQKAEKEFAQELVFTHYGNAVSALF